MKYRGFTLLEVIVAMAMFAMVAAPALSLMSLAARKSGSQIGGSNATELKRKIESAVETSGDPFGWVFGTDEDEDEVVLYASEDLSVIDYSDAVSGGNDRYYRIDVLDPNGYTYNDSTDAFRVFMYRIIWPAFVETTSGTYASNEANVSNLEELIFTSVVSK